MDNCQMPRLFTLQQLQAKSRYKIRFSLAVGWQLRGTLLLYNGREQP